MITFLRGPQGQEVRTAHKV